MKPLLALLVALAACPAPADDDDSAAPPDGVDPLAWDVTDSGPYHVGYVHWPHTYTLPGGAGERTIEVHLWYPTDDEENTSGEVVRYLGTFLDEDAWLYATPAPPADGVAYPVHAYTHGHRGFAGSSAFLARRLASHGWVTIAPDHTNNTLIDNVDPRATSLYFARSTDVSESIDQLEAVGLTHLAGAVDTSRVLLSGHSFGSHSTWASGGAAFDMDVIEARCAAGQVGDGTCTPGEIEVFRGGLGDDRVAAMIPMAGTPSEDWFGPTGHLAVQHPVLNMSGTDDDVGAQGMFDKSDGLDFTWIEVEGGCHHLFGLGACENIPTDEGFSIVGTYALAFARAHVLGDAGATTQGILDHSIEVSDRVAFQRHER
jgi:predicted dienelactone hydrolase